MSEHRSVWIDREEAPSYPALTESIDVDVAVVGGGITGVTSAVLLKRAGLDVALVEADRIASGTTGYTTGKVTSQHGLCYRALIQKHGVDKASIYAEANERAIEVIESLCDVIGGATEFTRAPAFVYTQSVDRKVDLEAEQAAASRLGLAASLVTETDLPFDIELALRFDDQAHIHAYNYVRALATFVNAGDGRVYEQSRVLDVDEHSDRVVIETDRGEVRARAVVCATLLPFIDKGGIFTKCKPSRSYGIAARLSNAPPAGMYISAELPVRSVRPWGTEGVIVVGEDHPTGDDDAGPARWGELERWTRERFDVAAFEYRWSAQDYETADGVPYVGRSPRSTRTYVATGFGKWGLTGGTAAALILADLLHGREHRWLPTFDVARLGSISTPKHSNGRKAHLDRLIPAAVDGLERGHGAVVAVGADKFGAYRGADSRVQAVSLICTHQGCTLKWNRAETSWDCPCHGSRFDYDGTILNGPAVEPLESIKLED